MATTSAFDAERLGKEQHERDVQSRSAPELQSFRDDNIRFVEQAMGVLADADVKKAERKRVDKSKNPWKTTVCKSCCCTKRGQLEETVGCCAYCAIIKRCDCKPCGKQDALNPSWEATEKEKLQTHDDAWTSMSNKLRKKALTSIIAACLPSTSNTEYNYAYGTPRTPCCKVAFLYLHPLKSSKARLSEKTLFRIGKEISENKGIQQYSLEERGLDAKTLDKMFKKKLQKREKGLLGLREGEREEITYCDMLKTFSLMADAQPNADSEWHIEEGMTYEDVYNDHAHRFRIMGIKPVPKDRYMRMWHVCFPYVKVRRLL